MTTTAQFFDSNAKQLGETVRLLSTKDPIAFAQVTETVTSTTEPVTDDMIGQFMTDAEIAQLEADARGIGLEDLTPDELSSLGEVDPRTY